MSLKSKHVEMVPPFCLVFLISVWFPLHTVCSEDKTIDEENIVPLQDFKVKVSPGFINITWNCNITESMKHYHYEVKLQKGHYEDLNVSMCSFVYKVHITKNFEVHKGVSVQLLVTNTTSTNVHSFKELIYMPEGKNNSAAENFACVIYNVSIMNCSWTAGKEAPEDTQYSLVLRQYPNKTSECQDYRTDSVGRQVGCVLKRPNISFKSKVYAAVLGSSKQTSIQFFDKVYLPIQDVILDPPRNITLTYNSDELEIKWQKPETYDNLPENSFWYNIIIKDKVTKIIRGSEENVYKTTEYHANEKVTVAMRAKWDQRYSHNSEWSVWSKPITGGNSPPLTSHHILIVLGVVTPIILIVLIVLCYRFRIWMRLFPQIPKPSMKLFEQIDQKEKSVPILSEIEILSMKKAEEEFIWSYVTEMPEKLKTLNTN